MSDTNMSDHTMNCCIRCFRDKAIKEYIKEFEHTGNCDFCDAESVFIIDIAKIAEFIDRGIERKYATADEGSLDLWDILHNEEQTLDTVALCDTTSLFNAILEKSKYHEDSTFIHAEPYGEPQGSAMYMGDWQEFCRLVKHELRFTIFLRFAEQVRKRGINDPMPPYIGTPEHRTNRFWYDMDEPLLKVLNTIKPRTILRARKFKAGCAQFAEEELTSPPEEKTCNGRMSPVGISYFYGAEDGPQNGEATCVAEVRPDVGSEVVLAPFEVIKDLTVLDLCDLPPAVSIFSEKYDLHFEGFVRPFLKKFGEQIAEPVDPNDELIEYIPTQVFCEFIRNNYSGREIHGIRYRSALNQGGVCLVLFRGRKISLGPDPWLSFGTPKHLRVSATTHRVDAVTEDTPVGNAPGNA